MSTTRATSQPSSLSLSHAPPEIRAYLLDTRLLWNTTASDIALKENARNAITATSREALALVSTEEAAKAGRFFFHRDARLCLASSLLKRFFVVDVLGHGSGVTGVRGVPRMPDGRLATRRVPQPLPEDGDGDGKAESVEPRWDQVRFGRRGGKEVDGVARGKPCYGPVSGDDGDRIDFNTTHQAGLVLLAGLKFHAEQSYSIGVDVTCVSERYHRDMQMIEQEGGGVRGFSKFVGMHEEIFSEGDLAAIQAVELNKDARGEGNGADEGALKAKLRRFYAFWALKEAYVKMEGEALLAEWLRDVEFRNVRVPRPAVGDRRADDGNGTVSSGAVQAVWDQAVSLGTEVKHAITAGTSTHASPDSAKGNTTANHTGSHTNLASPQNSIRQMPASNPSWGETIDDIEVYVRGIRRENIQMFLQAFEDEYLVSTAVLRDAGTPAVVAPVFHHLDLEREIFPVARKMERKECVDDIADAA